MIRDLVLGIDPASVAGWAVETLGGDLVESGVWIVGKDDDGLPGDRWILFRHEFAVALSKYGDRLCAAGIERPSTQQFNTARVLFGQLAIAEMMLSQYLIPSHLVAPSQIKKAATGNGRADKVDVVKSMEARFGPLSTAPGGKTKADRARADKARSDEADARGAAMWVVMNHDAAALARRELVRCP